MSSLFFFILNAFSTERKPMKRYKIAFIEWFNATDLDILDDGLSYIDRIE